MSSFFDALTDPAVDALLGMSQGFAQAAMPQRMPTPWGAAIGMGLGGALPGVAAGQSLQKSGITNEQAKIALDWYHKQYGGMAPFGAPPGGSGAGAGGGTAVAGPPGGGGDQNSRYLVPPQMLASMIPMLVGSGNEKAVPAIVGALQHYAGTPGNAMAPNGTVFQPPGSSADPYVIRRNAEAEASGKVGPAIAQAAGIKNVEAPFTPPTQYDVPDLNPDGSQHLDAQGNPTFHKQLMTPMQANSAVNGAGAGDAPVAATPSPFPGWAKQIIGGIENPGGNPTAKNPQSTAAGNGQFTEGTWPAVIRSGRPDLAAGKTDAQLMALRNDPGVAQDATEQYARQNAGELVKAGFRVNGPTIAMAHGLGPAGAISVLQKRDDTPVAAFMPKAAIDANPYLQNGATVADVKRFYAGRMGYGGGRYQVAQAGGGGVAPASVAAPAGQPGIAGPQVLTPQQKADLDVDVANRNAINEAAAARTKLITTRAGVVDPTQIDPETGMAKEIYRQPEYHETIDPNTGQEYPTFLSPAANGQLSIHGGPPGLSHGQIPPTKFGPGMEDTVKHLADQYANEDKQKYEGATNSLFQLDQQDKNITALNQGGGWSSTGAGANAKLEWAKGINSAFQTLGAKPVFDPEKVASWEDATKIQTQLAFAQAKQLGSREAQQVISMSRAATPGAENTPQGYQAISSGYHEMNNREVDSYAFKTAWLQSHGGNLTGAETAFNNQFTPKMYADRAVSTVKPVNIPATDQATAMAQMAKYLPGTVVTLANGKQTIVPPRPNAPSVPSYIQEYLKPPGATNAP